MVTGNYEVIKSVNTSLVLNTLRIYKELSRSDLTRITGLTSGTITNITNKLLELNLIKETTIPSSGTGGRKPILLKMNEKGAYAIAVDVRINSIEILLVDLEAKIMDTFISNEIYTVEAGMKVIIEKINWLVNKNNIKDKLLGIGLSLPGWIDYERGRIVNLPNLPGWENFPLKTELEHALHYPVFIENDANASALGELWFGKGKTYNNMIYVLVEDGIGSGFILNQQIYRGNGISVGELGHLSISNEKRLCSCGNVGCLDTVASAKGMLTKYQEKTTNSVNFNELIERIKADDLEANQIMNEAAEELGLGISILVNLYHPEAIIFGGKVMKQAPNFLPLVKKALSRKALKPIVQDMVFLSSDIENSSILGAVALVFQSTLQPYSLKSVSI